MQLGMRLISATRIQRPWRALAIALILSLLFGLLEMGDPLENALRTARNKANPIPASGDIVVVTIDDASQAELGSWPWPRKLQADMVDRLTETGASKILLDVTFQYKTDRTGDQAFADALQRSGRVVLPVHIRSGEGEGSQRNGLPGGFAMKGVSLGTISLPYNYVNEVWHIPYGLTQGGRTYRSFSSIMGGVEGQANSLFPINYRIDLNTVPRFTAAQIMSGQVRGSLRGKTVIVGAMSDSIGDMYGIPGRGRWGGVFIQVLGAETLKLGIPVSLGWLPMLLALVPLAFWATRTASISRQVSLVAAGTIAALVVPIFAETRLWFMDVTPALFFLSCIAVSLTRKRFRARGTINLTSGLPNLAALRERGHQRDHALVVARVVNYPQLAAAVAGQDERALVEQIVHRLTVGAQDHLIFHGDEGIFAWLAEPGTAIGHHVEALHALFRSPARIAGETYDLNVAFGVESGSGTTIGQRLNSALAAADEAASEGLRWKYHDPERMKDANWRLSLLSQLDQAIDDGEVWVAFQPQLDLRTGRIRGAEALARWTHPEKGPIGPQEFITAAEQGGRIEKLTMFVLERSIATAARINRDGTPFDMAVNLSARMLTSKSLPADVKAALARHGLDPARLTLELTETAALARDGSDMAPLLALRDLGVRLSIDDYGTGLSTLDYLKKVPASEIKIDQSFVRAMREHRSDLVMVQSTIALAHSLDRTVVAEGVETQELLELLRSLGCDSAQGFLIGRPVSARGLMRRLQEDRNACAA